MNEKLAGIILGLLGCFLVIFRYWGVDRLISLYSKRGFTINRGVYARQFSIIGIAFIIIGILMFFEMF